MSALPLHALLPRVSPAVAQLRTALLGALSGLAADGEALIARVQDTPPEGGWIVFDTAPGIMLLRLRSGDPVGAAALLGEAEPLVSAIESALGVELIPVGSAARPSPDAVVIALGDGRAWLGIAPNVTLGLPKRARPIPTAFATFRVPVAVGFAAPPISPADLTALAAGDLIVCAADTPATLRVGARIVHARLIAPPLRIRVEAITHIPETMMNLDAPAVTHPPQAHPPSSMGDLPVPVTIALEGVTLALSTIAKLAEGSVIELGHAGSSLPVRLLVGERIVATGELIAVGGGYGVLIGAAT